jgi:hypothetical protein
MSIPLKNPGDKLAQQFSLIKKRMKWLSTCSKMPIKMVDLADCLVEVTWHGGLD